MSKAGTEGGASIVGSFSGAYGWAPPDPGDGKDTTATDIGLVINEVASKGDPLDWFELYNASDAEIALADFLVADDLTDPGKRVAFPADLVIQPGEYLQIELDRTAGPALRWAVTRSLASGRQTARRWTRLTGTRGRPARA